MKKGLSIFEYIILIVGIVLTYFGFNVIDHLYRMDGRISWLMIIAIFTWLMLLVMFIFLSMNVDATRRQLKEIKYLREILNDENEEHKLLRKKLGNVKKK